MGERPPLSSTRRQLEASAENQLTNKALEYPMLLHPLSEGERESALGREQRIAREQKEVGVAGQGAGRKSQVWLAGGLGRGGAR